jgi:hypothetical protein
LAVSGEMSGKVVQVASSGGKNVCISKKGKGNTVVQIATGKGKNIMVGGGDGCSIVMDACDGGSNYCDMG